MKQFILLLFGIAFTFSVQAQESLLQSGPMVGYSTMKEVMLWVQTKEASQVYFEYWNQDRPQHKFKTEILITAKENGFIARLIADQLQPGNQYNYAVYINDQLVD
ncbi:MAG: alkaline phosphatase family protein, partial [Bacteroidales bacterium]|nr:alkaline phosphatase family protein [Bacteroidales bacterium]